jgi:hypothetical protein
MRPIGALLPGKWRRTTLPMTIAAAICAGDAPASPHTIEAVVALTVAGSIPPGSRSSQKADDPAVPRAPRRDGASAQRAVRSVTQAGSFVGAHASQDVGDDPDALYARRQHIESALRAAEIWTSRLEADPGDFESAWRLARAMYWLGGHGPEDDRRRAFEDGIASARQAITLQPDRPEGHFWLATNMGGLAESFGLRAGIRYRRPIKEALERVLEISPAFQQGSADRALGRWYYRVPALFGGSKTRSEEHLRRSLTYNPHSTASLYFLAETQISRNRIEDARVTLRRLAAAPLDPEWEPEDRDFKAKGQALLARLGEAGDR